MQEACQNGYTYFKNKLLVVFARINEYNPFARTLCTLVNTDWFRGQSRDHLQQFSLSFAAGVRRDNRDGPPVAVELGMVIANEEPRMPGELRRGFLRLFDKHLHVRITEAKKVSLWNTRG